jgi:glycosyltransferase involved in cell wall biosynthesis
VTARPTRRPHVLIIVENLPVPFDRRVWQEATTLRRAGADVTVICPLTDAWPARHEVIDGVEIFRHPLDDEGNGPLGYLKEYATALFWESVLSFRVRFRRRIDVIQGCNPPDLIFLVALAHRVLFRTPYVFDHHDISPELFEAKFGGRGPLWRVITLMERWSYRSAAHAIVTNESYRTIAIERGGKRPDEVTIVRSGPDLTRLVVQPPVAARRRGRRHLVAYLGVMGKQEGIDDALDAVEHIVRVRGRADVSFTFVGSGPELPALRRRATEMGLDDVVQFTGRVPDAELLEILNTADVCINPDTFNPMNDKSTMNKIVEYMALGKPIVQFDLHEGRVSAQEASLYARPHDVVDFADKIVELLDDPERRRRMGDVGRHRVETELHWGREAPKLLGVYRRFVELDVPPESVDAPPLTA